MNVGQSSPANTFLAIWMAQAAGLYESQKLDVSVVRMVGGRDIGPALESGRIQVMHIGMSSVVRANNAGAKLKVVASLSNVIRFTMFAAPGIRTAADLKGAPIGISSLGSESDATISLSLRKLGMDRQDVDIREIGLHRLEAVRTGAVAATALNEPDRSRAFALGLTPIVDLSADRTPWIFTGLVVDASYLSDHRGAVLRFLRATAEGNYLALTNPARAKEVLAKELELADRNIVDLSYEDYRSSTPADLEISVAGAENVLATVGSSAARSLEDYIDLGPMKELRATGVIESMRTKYSFN